jgi:hypothetical protein
MAAISFSPSDGIYANLGWAAVVEPLPQKPAKVPRREKMAMKTVKVCGLRKAEAHEIEDHYLRVTIDNVIRCRPATGRNPKGQRQ